MEAVLAAAEVEVDEAVEAVLVAAEVDIPEAVEAVLAPPEVQEEEEEAAAAPVLSEVGSRGFVSGTTMPQCETSGRGAGQGGAVSGCV